MFHTRAFAITMLPCYRRQMPMRWHTYCRCHSLLLLWYDTPIFTSCHHFARQRYIRHYYYTYAIPFAHTLRQGLMITAPAQARDAARVSWLAAFSFLPHGRFLFTIMRRAAMPILYLILRQLFITLCRQLMITPCCEREPALPDACRRRRLPRRAAAFFCLTRYAATAIPRPVLIFRGARLLFRYAIFRAAIIMHIDIRQRSLHMALFRRLPDCCYALYYWGHYDTPSLRHARRGDCFAPCYAPRCRPPLPRHYTMSLFSLLLDRRTLLRREEMATLFTSWGCFSLFADIFTCHITWRWCHTLPLLPLRAATFTPLRSLIHHMIISL